MKFDSLSSSYEGDLAKELEVIKANDKKTLFSFIFAALFILGLAIGLAIYFSVLFSGRVAKIEKNIDFLAQQVEREEQKANQFTQDINSKLRVSNQTFERKLVEADSKIAEAKGLTSDIEVKIKLLNDNLEDEISNANKVTSDKLIRAFSGLTSENKDAFNSLLLQQQEIAERNESNIKNLRIECKYIRIIGVEASCPPDFSLTGCTSGRDSGSLNIEENKCIGHTSSDLTEATCCRITY